MRRLSRGIVVGVLVATLLAACRPDTVRISFTPRLGARYRYTVHVHAATSSTLGSGAARRETPPDDYVINSEQRVVAVGADSTQVEVRLDIPAVGTRTLTATFDRAAQLSAVTSVEGVPSAALGQLGLSEILPGATGAPPPRPLAPGARWNIDAPTPLLGGGGSRLKGTGRLVSLGVVHGRDVATITSTYRLPVDRVTSEGSANLRLVGRQTTEITTVRTLADGAVESATAITRGQFNLTVVPPSGAVGAPVTGTLTVELRSETKRVR